MLEYTEFFCGIGGLATCLPPNPNAFSIDINQSALAVHRLNCEGRQTCKTIESLAPDDLTDAPTQLWWMSPPCQPFTRRGLQRDVEDPRSAGFRNMLGLISELKPTNLAMENVPEFQDSESAHLLRMSLNESGYDCVESVFCPTDLGARNRRRRYFLAASRAASVKHATLLTEQKSCTPIKLQSNIDLQALAIPREWLENYGSAIDIIDEDACGLPETKTACFTSAYGRSPVRSGSYLRASDGQVRFFTPLEILWQLGFPTSFLLPDWPPEKLWPLVGNTLSLPAVKHVLKQLPIAKDRIASE